MIKNKRSGAVKKFVSTGLVATLLLLDQPANTYSNKPLDYEEYYKTELLKSIEENKDSFPAWSSEAKLYRALEYKALLSEVESKYSIEPGLLVGLMIQESSANPLALNSLGDGGAGAFQFQPGTALSLGLKVYESNPSTGPDFEHGRSLRSLVSTHEYDAYSLTEIDERFDVAKSADAAGRYLSQKYEKYGDWDMALDAYRRGSARNNFRNTTHVMNIRKYQDMYLDYVSKFTL